MEQSSDLCIIIYSIEYSVQVVRERERGRDKCQIADVGSWRLKLIQGNREMWTMDMKQFCRTDYSICRSTPEEGIRSIVVCILFHFYGFFSVCKSQLLLYIAI